MRGEGNIASLLSRFRKALQATETIAAVYNRMLVFGPPELLSGSGEELTQPIIKAFVLCPLGWVVVNNLGQAYSDIEFYFNCSLNLRGRKILCKLLNNKSFNFRLELRHK